MTRDEAMEKAREWLHGWGVGGVRGGPQGLADLLLAVDAAAMAEERDACAQACGDFAAVSMYGSAKPRAQTKAALHLAERIRARGKRGT